MVRTLAHVCITAHDLVETEKFYCGILGMRRKFDFIRNGKLFGYYLEFPGGGFLEVFERGNSAEPVAEPQAITHLCMQSDDLDELSRKLHDNNCECTAKKLGADHTYQIWSKDPNGVKIEFHQYTEQSSQFSGAECVVNW